MLKFTLPQAVLDKHGLDNLSFVTEHVSDLARRLGGRRDEPVQNWLNIHEVAHPNTPAMEIMLLMLHGRTTSVPVVDKESGRLEGIVSFWDVLEKLTGENR